MPRLDFEVRKELELFIMHVLLPENKEKQAVNVNQLSKKMKVTPSLIRMHHIGPLHPFKRQMAQSLISGLVA